MIGYCFDSVLFAYLSVLFHMHLCTRRETTTQLASAANCKRIFYFHILRARRCNRDVCCLRWEPPLRVEQSAGADEWTACVCDWIRGLHLPNTEMQLACAENSASRRTKRWSRRADCLLLRLDSRCSIANNWIHLPPQLSLIVSRLDVVWRTGNPIFD